MWWKHGFHADSARLSRRWELTAELAALMDLTRLNYRPFRRRQYARKGAMDRSSKRTNDSNIMDRSRREKFRLDAVDNWTNWRRDETWKNFTFERISSFFIFRWRITNNTKNSTLLETLAFSTLTEKKLFLKGELRGRRGNASKKVGTFLGN